MRYSRMQNNKTEHFGKTEGKNGIFFFLAILAIAAAIYFIGAAKVGKFLTDKVFAPVFSLLTGSEEEQQESQTSEIQSTVAQQGESFTLTLPETHVYALQAGAYADENNATEYAQTLKNKGGAGYIQFDGEIYRVFIAAYSSQENAENVIQRLESEQNMQTKLYEIICAGKTISVTADAQTKEELEAATNEAPNYVAQLIDLALEYDKGNIDVSSAIEKLNEMGMKAKEQQKKIASLQQVGITGNYITALQVYYEEIIQILGEVNETYSQTEMSAFIKYAYMTAAFAQNELAGKADA